jgi:hypothetical protein
MRALQGTFTRLKARLTHDKKKEKEFFLAFYYCIILTVFNPHYNQILKTKNYDRIIARYYRTATF